MTEKMHIGVKDDSGVFKYFDTQVVDKEGLAEWMNEYRYLTCIKEFAFYLYKGWVWADVRGEETFDETYDRWLWEIVDDMWDDLWLYGVSYRLGDVVLEVVEESE